MPNKQYLGVISFVQISFSCFGILKSVFWETCFKYVFNKKIINIKIIQTSESESNGSLGKEGKLSYIE